jgi:CrcB protein
MRNVLLVFLGGGLGSVLRYGTVAMLARWLPDAKFPWGVFVANIAGSFILGFLCVLPLAKSSDQTAWLLTATGFLGGYTTFSTLSANTWLLLEGGSTLLALLNAFGSLVCGVLAAALGWWCGRAWS